VGSSIGPRWRASTIRRSSRGSPRTGEEFDAVGESVETYRGDCGDRESGGDDAEFRQPVAHDVAHVGAVSEAGPNAEQRVAGVGAARNPHLVLELSDLDEWGACKRMAGRDADHELALGERRQLERR
jgi:hypothetical protein